MPNASGTHQALAPQEPTDAELAAPPSGTAALERRQADLDARERRLGDREAAFADRLNLFEQASAAAKIGVWQCELQGEILHWTDAVYDIFDLPRGSRLVRKETLNFYPDASRELLQATRSRALGQGSGFHLEAEIVTAAGRNRWIRLTATVQRERGIPVRLFGMKQDITEEKILTERMRHLAEFDGMTGLANRSRFQSTLAAMSESVPGTASLGTLILIDLDGFKQINDTFGHALGDECLKETALRLAQVCGNTQLVARIGGDEFGVLLGSHADRRTVEALAKHIVEALGRPVERNGRTLRLGASVGVARADGDTPAELFGKADMALYAAKAAGRNTFRVFGSASICAQAVLA